MAELCGLVPVYKQGGMTSQTVVNRVKRIFGVSCAGHTGTLDPMAEGVLPILVGRGVKASEYLLESDKHYRATLLLGIETDTEDVTGKTLSTSDKIPDAAEVFATAKRFAGEILQVPPMYSAIRVGGRRLMELAREGQTVEREARPITVYSLDVSQVDGCRYTLDVHCSKGTYIRTLCADIGRALGCGGTMETLLRTRAAGIALEECRTLDEFAAMSEEERNAFVRPVDALFPVWEALTLPPFYARLAHNGLEIYLKKIGKSYEEGTRLRLYDERGFFALAEVRSYENGLAAKPIKQF